MISETTRRAKNRNVTVTLLLQVLCICISKIGEDESPRFLRGNGMPSADRKNASQEAALALVLVNFRRRQQKSGNSSGKILPSSPYARITGIAWPPGNFGGGPLPAKTRQCANPMPNSSGNWRRKSGNTWSMRRFPALPGESCGASTLRE